MDVREKAVLVAGAGGGLGSAIAKAIAETGARVAAVDARKIEPGELPANVSIHHADLADDQSVASALSEIVAATGKISVLINCAGLIHSEPLINLMDPSQRRHRLETWNETIRSNLTATFMLCSHVAEHMAATRTKGLLINFSSISASGNPGQTAYAAAKAGVEAMTSVWARELGPLGIRAVAIAPGFVATPSTERALSDATLAELKRRTPLMRLAKPEEIASAVQFVIANDFVTGTTISVDGGLVL